MSRPVRSLADQLTRSLLGAVAGVWLLLALGSAATAQSELAENLDGALADTAHRLLDLALHELPPASAAVQVQRGAPGLKDDALAYQVVDASHRVLLRSHNAPDTALNVPLQTGFSDLPGWRVYTYQHPDRPVFIHMADAQAHRREALWDTLLWLLLPLLAVLPLLGWLIRRITRRGLAPVQHISTQIGQRGGHNLLPLTGQSLPSELQTITDSTNHLLQRLTEALNTERALAANAAHELRTPLAATVLRLHALRDLPLEAAARREADKALESVVQLSHRAEKLLQLSRAESAASWARAPVALAALAGTVAQEFWSQDGLLARLQLCVPPDADAVALGDFDALAIVLRNLVENALRHGGQGAVEIVVELPATLRVRDQGPGVSLEALALVRQRHVKNMPGAAGYGLGLSIVGSIVQLHGGALELASPPAGRTRGFEAVVRLPVRVARDLN